MNQTDFDQAFTGLDLTPEARKVLNDYLERLQKSAGALKSDDQKELVRDIKEHLYNALEVRMKKSRSKKDTLDAQIVLEVLSALGEPSEYLEATQADSGVRGLTPPRKLRRAREGRLIGGVAMGIANYFRIDVVLVRILIVGLVLTGVSIVIYPLMWWIIPEETEAEHAVNQTSPLSSTPLPRWLRVLGRIGLKVLIIFIALTCYLPILAVLTAGTVAGFALPFVTFSGLQLWHGAGMLSLLGYLLPVFSIAVGSIFLVLLLLFIALLARVHYHRTVFRGSTTRYLGALALIALLAIVSSGSYLGMSNLTRDSISATTSYPVSDSLDIIIEGDQLPASVTVTGSDATDEYTLTEIRSARAFTNADARDLAEKLEIDRQLSDDSLTLTARTSRSLSGHFASVAYEIIVPRDLVVTIHNTLGETVVSDLDTSTLTIKNQMGQLTVEDSVIRQIDLGNEMGRIIMNDVLSSSPVLTVPASSPVTDETTAAMKVPQALQATLKVVSDMGSIELDSVTSDRVEISGHMGGITIIDCDLNGSVENDMGSITITRHTGVLSVTNSMGSTFASFTRMNDGEKYSFKSDMGSLTLKLPAGLDPDIETSVSSGHVDEHYREVNDGPRPSITIDSNMGSVEIK